MRGVPVDTLTRSSVRSEPIHTDPAGPAVTATGTPPKVAGTEGSRIARTRCKVTGLTSVTTGWALAPGAL